MVLDEIAAAVVGAGLGTLAADLFLSSAVHVPAVDTPVVQLFEYGGLPPRFVHGPPGIAHDLPRVQVLVRAKAYAAARLRADLLYLALGQITNATLDGTRTLRVTPQQSPYDLGPDDVGRAQVGFNVQVERMPP